MPHDPEDSADPLSPLLNAAFAARELRVEARGTSVVAQLCLSQGIEPTPLTFGSPTRDESLETSEPALPTPTGSRYQILDELGRGGLGLVLRTRDVDLRREVALKVLRSQLSDRKDLVERFLLEAQVGGQLQHPGIAPVYDLGITRDGRPFFTMKLVQGNTLTMLLDERASESGETVHLLGVFSQICKAVGYAHARGVVHRDLKPANVMVGEFGEVQVVDWGLAKVSGRAEQPLDDAPTVSPDLSARPQSRPGTIIGTPGYMAPEQARGETAGPGSDVYSLGVILFEILAEHPLAELAAAESLDLEHIRVLLPEHDPDLHCLVLECLSTDPAGRPHDALEVGRRIDAHMTRSEERIREALIRAASERARADEAGLRIAAESRARRLTVLTAAVVLVAVLAGGGTWTVIAERASDRELAASLEIEEALGRASAKQAEARTRARTATWMEALEAARGALAIATVQAVAPSLETRARSLVTELEGQILAAQEEDSRRQVAADLDEKLTALRAEAANDMSPRRHFEVLTEIFAEYGHPLGGITSEELGQRLLADGLLETVIRILDTLGTNARSQNKIMERPQGAQLRGVSAADFEFADGWSTFWTYAQALDPDSQRRELRAFALDEDASRLWSATQPLLESDVVSASTLDLAASVLRVTGRQEAALIIWRRAVRIAPDDYWVRDGLGHALFAAGENDHEALAHYEAATALNPESWAAWSSLAACLHRVGRYEASLTVERHALRLNPTNAMVRANVVVSLRALGRFEEILETTDNWLEHHAVDGGVFRARAAAHIMLMDVPGLRADLEVMRSVHSGPGHHDPLDTEDRGWVMMEGTYWQVLCEYDHALEATETSLAVDPEYPEALCNLGLLLSSQFGEYEAGVELRRQGHELGSRQASWTYPSAAWVEQQERTAAMAELFAENGPSVELPADPADGGLLAEVLFQAGEMRACCRTLSELQKAGRGGWEFFHRSGRTTHLRWAIALVKLAEDPDPMDGSPTEILRAAADLQRMEVRSAREQLPHEGTRRQKMVMHRMVHPGLASVRGEKALAKLDTETADAWRAFWSELEEWRQEMLAERK